MKRSLWISMSTRTNKDGKTIRLQPWAKFIRKERMTRRVEPKVQRKELKGMENYSQALGPNQETANLCFSSQSSHGEVYLSHCT